eukprot:7384493-Prymnesium_polylepis.5
MRCRVPVVCQRLVQVVRRLGTSCGRYRSVLSTKKLQGELWQAERCIRVVVPLKHALESLPLSVYLRR